MRKILHERWKEFARRMIFNGGMTNITDHRKQLLWSEIESFIDSYRQEPVDGWCGEYCLCDYFRETFGQTYGQDILRKTGGGLFSSLEMSEDPRKFYNQLEIVARASIDSVTGGDGVIGYTVGDLRAMFDGAIPRWLTQQYKGLSNCTPDSAGICL